MVPPHGVPLKSDIRSKLGYLILNGRWGIQKWFLTGRVTVKVIFRVQLG